MVTLTHICGFEEGGYTDGPYGAGCHSYTDTATPTFDSSIKRNGDYSLKVDANVSLLLPFSATAHVVGSIWFYWNGLDGTAQIVRMANTNSVIAVSNAGVVSASAGGAYTTGPTVAADTWHQLDWYLNVSANPWVLKWKVNSAAQTDVTRAVAATTEAGIYLGLTGSAYTGSVWYDDWVQSVTGADYPLGPYAVPGGSPTGDGTHVNASYFKDEAGVAGSGSSTYTHVAGGYNTATMWYMHTSDAAAYLEWTFPDTTRTNAIRGVSVSYAQNADSAFGGNDWALKLRANSNDGTIRSGNNVAPWAWQGGSTLFLTAPGGAAWTAAILNGATVRFGYGSDTSPFPYVEFVTIEAAFVDTPNESEGGGDPPPVVGVPGIWIDWVGDGTWVDETTRTISVNWSRGASFDHVSSPGPGNATVVLQNSDDRFNPDNSGSALTGLLIPNRPIWCGADRATGSLTTSTTVTRGFFAGYVTEIVPTPVPGGNPTAELLAEDALGWYRRATATVSPVQNTPRSTFRQSVLTSIGEDVTRRSLEDEADTMPFASADARDAINVLEDLNKANSSRHFIAPADSYTEWYDYTLVNRLHKLASAADESWNADDIQALSGYRVTNDTIVNLQRATVSPINFGSINEIVWTATPLPLVITVGQPITLWPEFADYVFGAAVDVNSTGGTLTSTLTNFGTSAKLELTASGSVVNISSLNVTGSSLRRGDLQTVRSEDLTSQGVYGIQAGGDISTDFIGQPGAAKAVTDYLIWKFSDPLKRPTITRMGKDATTIASLLDRDLFDVVTLTVDRLQVVSKRFEIIGIRGTVVPKSAEGPFYSISYELQETANSAPTTYWIWNTSSWNTDTWAPF